MEGEFTTEIIEEMIESINTPIVYRLTVLDVMINSDLEICRKNNILGEFDRLVG